MPTLRDDLDKLRAETLAAISKVAAELRDATDEDRKKDLEKRLEELEGVESDILDLRARFTIEQLNKAATPVAAADVALKRDALKKVLSALKPASASAAAPAPAEPPIEPPAEPTPPSGPSIILREDDIDLLSRVAASEVGHFGKHGENQLVGGLSAVVDTILNRVAHPSFPSTLDGVVNARFQFSAINDLGDWRKLPPASDKIVRIVRRHLQDRVKGGASVIGGATHFLNPFLSSKSALDQWGDHVVANAVGVFGNEEKKDVHFHGFAPGAAPPPPYTLFHHGDMQPFEGDGVAHVASAAGLSADVVAGAEKEWDFWGQSIHNKLTGAKFRPNRDDDPAFAKYILDTYCAAVGDTPSIDDIADDRYFWSAVFVSCILKQAGLTSADFAFSNNHSVYIRDAIARRMANDATAAYWGYRIDEPEAAPRPGDIIGAPRGQGITKAKALKFFDRKTRYGSHCDIVVATRPGEIDVIGGNVRDAVTRKTIAADANGLVDDPTEPWFVVMKKR